MTVLLRWRLLGLCGMAALAVPALGQDLNVCGSLANHYGPYDYRTERQGKLGIVERSHFAPSVEMLVRGTDNASIEQHLNYVLRTSPNHHRALVSTIRLGERLKLPQIPSMDYSIECFLERGLRFQPDDTVVRALYARYLGKLKRANEGIDLLDRGLEYTTENPLSTYNFGLIYFELGDHERALKQAHLALKLGFPAPELSDMLKKAGKWREPPP
jgi:tetratricopeptide (TPR) repeat protein